MKLFSKVLGRMRHISTKKVITTAAVFVALTGASLVGASSIINGKVSAAPDCSPNSIIACGEANRAAFIAKVKSSPELQKIYATFGLKTTADYNRFITSAQPGVAFKSNNTIVVGGRVVATNVGSIGRTKSAQGSGPRVFNIAGAGTYYGNLNDKAFAAASIPVDVLFDAQGKMQFAVMTGTCANPVYAVVTSPTYQCTALNKAGVAGQANTFAFNTSASAGNGATIAKVVYNFGDGTPTVTETNPLTIVRHTFTKSATTSVSVYVSVPGGGTVILTNCTKAVTFTPPPAVFACNLLSLTPGKIDEKGNQSFTLTATASATNATIKSYNFTFGDGKTAPVTSSAQSVSTTHVYAPGNYNANVSVTVLTNTGLTKTVTAATCAKPVPVKAPECKPGVPVGSLQCKPSSLACVSLTPTPGAIDQTNGNQTYSFKATATASNATITSYSFSFDANGQPTVVTTSATTASTTHVYAPGTHNASVLVTGKDASGAVVTTVANSDCASVITVKAPECKPGVPSNSQECFTYTCDLFTVTKGDNRTVTISDFKASTTNPKANINNVVVDWGDDSDKLTSAAVVSQTHQFAADQSYTITATAHFAVTGSDNDITANGPNCAQTVSFTAVPPVTPPTELVNTGAGSVLGIFGATTIIGTIASRFFLARRLNRQ